MHEIVVDNTVSVNRPSVFDTALPQDWVDSVRRHTELNPVGHFVWAYDHGSIFGYPHPIDTYGSRILSMLYLTSSMKQSTY